MKYPKTFVLFVISFFIFGNTHQTVEAQYDPESPPNTFRSSDNPLYWKNKKPYPGYWQQDVHYKIQAKIEEKTDIIYGQQELTYWNNSPDTLNYVYFHLYQNAFQPGSYYDQLHEANNKDPRYGPYESKGLGTEISKMTVGGEDVKTELDNTILKVHLPEPLYPNDSVRFNIDFKTYFGSGSVRRRMKKYQSYGFTHYNGVHWYPRIDVYDRKFGWTTDQHLGKEFYGDFGTFDVELTFANNYIVGATGTLQNREEVMPDSLRDKLDISNFTDKSGRTTPSTIIEYDTTKHKTWHFYAENVHDFSFTADPAYRIDEVEWQPQGEGGRTIKAQALVREPKASGWKTAAGFTMDVTKVFSKDFGMYEYPKIIVADAKDGMEYPMITLDASREPYYRDLLAHEVGHMWYFGMLGTNETYRAAMDEGFTQFLTSWALNEIDGKHYKRSPPDNWYKRMFRERSTHKNREVYYGYIRQATRNRDARLNTHSHDFGNALGHGGGYGQVYYKMGTMFYNLQYVLGDSLFQDAMKHYTNQWKIAHPYFEDFRNSIIRYTDVDLNWFFDQWWATKETIDYGVKSIKKGDEQGDYDITFVRKGKMEMPIDFRVITKDSTIHDYHIPNTNFVKETDAKVLPKWYGIDNMNDHYTAEISIDGKIKNVVIDPTNRLADVNMLNNSKKAPIDFSFDHRMWNFPDWKEYNMYWRPDVWYNSYDGIKAGLHFNGHYMFDKHRFSATAWFNTGWPKGSYDWESERDEFAQFEDDNDIVNFNLQYSTTIDPFLQDAKISLQAKHLDGLDAGSIGIDWNPRDRTHLSLEAKTMYRADQSDLQYLIHRDEWQADMWNTVLDFGFKKGYNANNNKGSIELNLRSSTLASDYDYNYLDLTFDNTYNLWRIPIKTRIYSRIGTGSNLAPESALYMAGANPEKMMGNKYTRSRGIFPSDWSGYGPRLNHFHYGGGLNLRGYAGYYVVEDDGENTNTVYRGNSGGSINVEIDLDDMVNWQPPFISDYLKFDTYLFGDAGSIIYENDDDVQKVADFRIDAGLGTALTIKKFGPMQRIKPLTIRLDVPVFLNRPPASETTLPDDDINNYFRFRWVIGVQRAF